MVLKYIWYLDIYGTYTFLGGYSHSILGRHSHCAYLEGSSHAQSKSDASVITPFPHIQLPSPVIPCDIYCYYSTIWLLVGPLVAKMPQDIWQEAQDQMLVEKEPVTNSLISTIVTK